MEHRDLKKKRITEICNNLSEVHSQNDERKKPDSKAICCMIPFTYNSRASKTDLWL